MATRMGFGPSRPAPTIVWRPQSRPQEALLACTVQDVFYGGARGGGKSDGLIGDFGAHAGEYGVHARGILFRRSYTELEEVQSRTGEVYGRLGWKWRAEPRTWTAPNGATLKLRYMANDADALVYQGHSYTWQGWDELTHFPSPKPVDLLWATLRSAHGVPCVRRSTGNPGGPGHSWVKRRYIDRAPGGYRIFAYAPTPSAPDLTIEAVFIPSRLDDNPLIAATGYETRIAAAAGEDGALWRAWRYGDWEVFAGQMYTALRREVHVAANRRPGDYPRATTWFAAMDWGYVQGAYGLWAALPGGTLELVKEFVSEFQSLAAYQAARAIGEATREWPRPALIWADAQMWQRHGASATLAEEYQRGLADHYGAAEAPGLVQGVHTAGSRATKSALIHAAIAWQDVRDTQGALLPHAGPRLRIAARCPATWRVLTEIPRDADKPEEVDADYSDDHAHDMVGFAVAARSQATQITATHAWTDPDVGRPWHEERPAPAARALSGYHRPARWEEA